MTQPSLDTLLHMWRQRLSAWSRTGDLVRAAQHALRLAGVPDPLRQLALRWGAGHFEDLPPVVPLSSRAMSAAAGAYSLETGTIYLNGDWLQRVSPHQAMAVLTEELGHHLDGLLNSNDTPGDEGEMFAALLIGNGSIAEGKRQALLAENDHGSLRVADQSLAVEQASQVTSSPIAVSTPGRTNHEVRNDFAFAALRSDGSVVSWGDGRNGGDSSSAAAQLGSGVIQIFSAGNTEGGAFAALKSDGSVVPWGNPSNGGNSGPAASRLTADVTDLFSTGSAFAALKRDGSVVSWGNPAGGGNTGTAASRLSADVTKIFSTGSAFAALKRDGSVITWGDPASGGNTGTAASRLTAGVTQIVSTPKAFAALKTNGSVVTWGHPFYGGNSGVVAPQLTSGVQRIFAAGGPAAGAFAALKTNGSVITWGDPNHGGDSRAVSQQLSAGVVTVVSTHNAFAALKSDGSVVTWGFPPSGGDSGSVAPRLAFGVTQIVATSLAFAALKSDGSVITWGESAYGGDSIAVAPQLFSGVTQIVSTTAAFAALKGDGSVVTWGRPGSGGDSSVVAFQLSSNVTQIVSTGSAFAALKSDGSVVTWGDSLYGGFTNPGPLTNVVAFATPFTDDRLIVATEPPIISLAVSPDRVTEDGSGNLIYTFTRTGPVDNPLTVSYKVGGSAIPDSDYTGIAVEGPIKTVMFAAGASTALVTVDPSADGDIEEDETVVLMLVEGSGYSIDSTIAFGTISNDDFPVITLSVFNLSVIEDGTSNLYYNFKRSGQLAQPLSVYYSVAGTATPGSDYAGIAVEGTIKSVIIPAGYDTFTVVVDPSSDAEIELDESIELSLREGNGYVIGSPSPAVAFITNDDFPIITLEVTPAAVSEDGAANLVYTFTRTGPTGSWLSVNYTVGGSASLGIDYTGIDTTDTNKWLTFSPGSSTAIVTLDPSADTLIETDETVALSLSPGSGYSIGTSSAVVGTINNDDVPIVRLSVSPASVVEDGQANLIYTFTRTDTTGALTVNYTVTGSATLGSDYTGIATNGSTKQISFVAGSSTATVSVDPTADTTVELNETVALTLAAGNGYTIGTLSTVTGTIINDDLPQITLTLAPASVTEDGPANLIYTFTRTGPAADSLTVNYTVAGTATLATDYTVSSSAGGSRRVSFAPGSSTATVTVDPTTDTTIEPNETVSLTLASGSGYVVGAASSVTGIITNDDFTPITLSVAPGFVAEDGTANLVYTFSRSGSTSTSLTVNYSLWGSASHNLDYTIPGAIQTSAIRTITFAAGSSTTTLTVDPTVDPTVEANESVIVQLEPGTGYSISGTPWVTGTINNDDPRIMLYDANSSSLPNQQGWLSFGTLSTGSQATTSNGTILNSSIADSTGYSNHALTGGFSLVNSAFPSLNQSVGFALDFQLQVLSESHQSDNRAGVSLIVLDQASKPRGIELGFWSNSIFSMAGASLPFQTIAERVDNINTTVATNYSLRFLDQRYYLLAGNRLLLSGSAQEYVQSAADVRFPNGAFGSTIYNTRNLLFLGDNNSRAGAQVSLGDLSLTMALTGTPSADTLIGAAGPDSFNGLAGADQLNGGGGNDWLSGGADADALDGGPGDDLLSGGHGADRFVFQSSLPFDTNQLGADTIVDFNPAEDRIRLARATFTALPISTILPATAFAVVSGDEAAANSTATIVYNSTNGGLFYNANGSAAGFAGSATGGGLFAQLWGRAGGAPYPTLTSSVIELL